nr:PREDICTED: uncharacterized protein LOC109037304 isoform X2 [Bemisia tabaci]
MQINFKQCKCSDANSRETAHQLQNPSRPPLASLTLHNDSGSNNTLLEISKKLDRTEETTSLRIRTRVIRRPNRGVTNGSSRTTQIVTAAVDSNENASRGASHTLRKNYGL